MKQVDIKKLKLIHKLDVGTIDFLDSIGQIPDDAEIMVAKGRHYTNEQVCYKNYESIGEVNGELIGLDHEFHKKQLVSIGVHISLGDVDKIMIFREYVEKIGAGNMRTGELVGVNRILVRIGDKCRLVNIDHRVDIQKTIEYAKLDIIRFK